MNKIKNIIKSKKGSAIFQTIIIMAIVAILAVTTLPNLNSKIEDQADDAITRIETVGSTLDGGTTE
jgi:competence protein ComGC